MAPFDEWGGAEDYYDPSQARLTTLDSPNINRVNCVRCRGVSGTCPACRLSSQRGWAPVDPGGMDAPTYHLWPGTPGREHFAGSGREQRWQHHLPTQAPQQPPWMYPMEVGMPTPQTDNLTMDVQLDLPAYPGLSPGMPPPSWHPGLSTPAWMVEHFNGAGRGGPALNPIYRAGWDERPESYNGVETQLVPPQWHGPGVPNWAAARPLAARALAGAPCVSCGTCAGQKDGFGAPAAAAAPAPAPAPASGWLPRQEVVLVLVMLFALICLVSLLETRSIVRELAAAARPAPAAAAAAAH